jgi:nitroreductase
MNCDALFEVLRGRRSIRRFAPQPVARADVIRLLEAAGWAPSNHNRQPWRFLVLEDPGRIRWLAAAVASGLAERLKNLPPIAAGFAGGLERHATLFADAPVVIVALHRRPVAVVSGVLEGLAEPSLVSGEPLSVAMAVQNLMLAAHTLGLGTCMLTAPLLAPGAFAAVGLPSGESGPFGITCLVALGHPAEQPAPPRRKALAQIVEFVDTPGVTPEYAHRRGDT